MCGNLTNHLVECDSISSAGILLSFTPTMFHEVNEHLIKDSNRQHFKGKNLLLINPSKKYFVRKLHHLNYIFNYSQ